MSLRWSVDGEFLYFDTNITGRYNIWQVPSNGGWPAQLTVSDERNMLEDPSPDGRHLLYAQDEQGNEKPNLYLLSLDNYTVKNLTQTDKIGYRDMRWSPDGRSLIFAAERESPGAYPIWQMDSATGTVKKIVTNEAGDCEYLEYSPDGKKIAYSTTRNYQYTGVRVKDLEAGAETVLAPIDDKSTTIVQGWTRDSKRVYVTSNANQQGIEAVALLELKENPEFKWLTLGQWDSQMVAVSDAEDNFVNPHLVVYPSYDETPIASFLYIPANIKPDNSHPAIIYPHGGPQWEHFNSWYPRLQYFVSHGYVVMAPNFRGSTGFGREFTESLRKDCGGGDLKDLVAATEYLKRTGYVDPDRIAIMGGSWGGYLTLIALTKTPEVWAAGVSIVPLANWFTAHENEDPVLQKNDEWLMGDPVTDRELWRDRSPIFFADKIRAPLLLLAGKNDIRCPVEETMQMAEAARKNGVTVEVKVYEDEGHGFVRRENEIDSIKRSAKFLETHVGQR